jgi:hypothetical protein
MGGIQAARPLISDDDPGMPFGDLAGPLRRGKPLEHRGQRFAAQRPPRAGRLRRHDPGVRLARLEPQQAAQETARAAHEHPLGSARASIWSTNA